MDLALALTAFLMGLAGAPHCAAMCGPSCAALLGAGRENGSRDRALSHASWAFHSFRLASYALAGGLTATSVGLLGWASQTAPWVRPVWTLLHVAALALGLWLAVTGRQPAFMASIGRLRPAPSLPSRDAAISALPIQFQRSSTAGTSTARAEFLGSGVARPCRMPGVLTGASAGALWVVWPCGLLQSALVVSGLANTPWGGAIVMLAFALASSMGLLWMPQLWAWWRRQQRQEAARAQFERRVVRLAGVLLALGSTWALGQDIWGRVWAYCFG